MNSEQTLKIIKASSKMIESAFHKVERDLKVLDIIKENFVWLENGKLYCGRRFDIEIPIDEDIEEKEEIELLKEWLGE